MTESLKYKPLYWRYINWYYIEIIGVCLLLPQVEFPEARIYEETLNTLLYETVPLPDNSLLEATRRSYTNCGSHSEEEDGPGGAELRERVRRIHVKRYSTYDDRQLGHWDWNLKQLDRIQLFTLMMNIQTWNVMMITRFSFELFYYLTRYHYLRSPECGLGVIASAYLLQIVVMLSALYIIIY